MQLWCIADETAVNAVLVTEFIRWPRRLGLTIFGAVGRNPKAWLFHVKHLENFARTNGADLLCGWMRKGYGRVTGWRETHRLYERDLT